MAEVIKQTNLVTAHEEARLNALRNYNILDTLPEADFDALTELASYICKTPVALISLIDTNRQWFKSIVGLSVQQTDRNIAFCNHTILCEDIFEIPDTHQNELVRTNPLVTSDPNIRFYAGAPLTTPDGYNIGSLCVIDVIPRQLTKEQRRALQTLAREVVSHLELRASKAKLEKENRRLEKFEMWFSHTKELMCVVNSTSFIYEQVNHSFKTILGYDPKEIQGRPIAEFVYEQDLQNTIAIASGALAKNQHTFEFENRMMSKNGTLHWFSWNVVAKNGYWYADGRDITESKKLKIILHDTQQMASVGGWELNIATKEVFWTEQLYHIHELPVDHPITFLDAVNFYHPDFIMHMSDAVDKAIRHCQPYDLELKLITAKGNHKWVRAIGKAVVEYNKVAKLIGTFQDITHKKEIEDNQVQLLTQLETSNKDLQQKERYLREINNLAALLINQTQSNGMLWEVPPSTIKELGFTSCSVFLINDKKQQLVRRATYTSNGVERFFNAAEKIPLGEGLIGTVALSGLTAIVNNVSQDARFAGKLPDYSSKIALPIIADGTVLGVISSTHAEVNFFTHQHQEILSTIANLVAASVKNATNLHKKKLIEQALRESEMQTRLIIDTALDGVIIIDSHGNITNWNSQAASIFGWSKEEAIHQNLNELIVPQAYRQAHHQGITRYIKTGEHKILNRRVEVTAMRKNGEVFPMELTVSPIHADNDIRFSAFVRDISERNKAKQDLEFISSRLTALMQNLHAGVMVVDDQRNIVISNKTFCEIFSFNSLEGVSYEQSMDAIKKLVKNPDTFMSRIPELIEAKQLCIGERIEMLNGKCYERDFIPIYSKEKYLGHLWQYNDVTDRKNAERKLKESEERYRQIIENATDFIYRIDAAGYFTYVNSTLVSLLDKSEDEILGKHFTSLIRQDFLAEVAAFYENQIAERVVSSYLEFPINNKFSKEVWIGQSIQMIFENGHLKEASAVARNITDKHIAEEKLRKSEEKYRSIIEHMKLGVLEVDREQNISFAYDRFCQMTGYRADELIGKNAHQLLPGHYRNTFHAKHTERLKGQSGVYETQIKKKNGEIIWTLVSGVPIFGEGQEVAGSIIIHLDITGQKNIERDLLNERIKAEESSKAKETFLANMSHEIRTPMNAIIGMSNLIADTALSTKQKKFLEAIKTSADNLLVIINDVLDFSKIESGKLVLETIGFSLERVVGSLMQSISYKADEKGISINSHIDSNISPLVVGDPVRLNQVLLNLVNNAIKFTSKGYVELHCILLKETATTQHIEFKVTDTGIGISQHKLHTIYDSFSQEDESITRRFGGTGLGLSICKQIVELMGGRIEVRSEKEKGSTFSFVIELRKGQHNEVVPIREEKKNVSLQGVKVLLVEDHEINRLLAFSMLHEWKVTIDIAENGSVAVDKVKNQGYDLILMDMQMPVMSGIEATKVIRKELQSTIPIIALTANASKMDARKYIKAGMNDYITKPFNPVHLFNKIAEHLKIEAGINQGYGHVKPEPVYLYAEPEKLFDLSKLLGMYNGNQEIVSKLVTIFRDNTPLILAQINEHFIHNRLNELAQLAHQLKPSIDFMGISTLSAHIRILEKCQQKTAQERQTSMEKLNQVLTLVFQQLAKLKLL